MSRYYQIENLARSLYEILNPRGCARPEWDHLPIVEKWPFYRAAWIMSLAAVMMAAGGCCVGCLAVAVICAFVHPAAVWACGLVFCAVAAGGAVVVRVLKF